MNLFNHWHRYWVTFVTIFTKEILRFTRIWVQTILPSVITTTLYFVIFGRLIGGRIGPMEGFAYLDFIVPGLVLMGVITRVLPIWRISASLPGNSNSLGIRTAWLAPLRNKRTWRAGDSTA